MNKFVRLGFVSILVWALVSLVAGPLAAQDPSDAGASADSAVIRPPKLDFTTHTLPNGLQVILLEDHTVPVINLQVWYHVGAKDERPGRTGFAHLFEHLMFKGSAHVGPDEHSRIVEAMGGFDNASTYDDFTNFYETFPSNALERVLWLEADRMGSLNVDQANFTSEREVVKEERRVRIENEPYGYLEEDLRAAAFTVHAYHHTAIGSMADLDKATLADVRDFFSTFYKPNNATLVIVGDFNSDRALAWTTKYFGGIPASAKPIPRLDDPEPLQTAQRVVNKSYSNTPLPAVVIGYKIPAIFTPDSYPLSLTANILAGGESSRLYQVLVYKDRIAVQAAGFGNFTEDPNLFWTYAILNAGQTPAAGEKALIEVLDSLKSEPIGAHELEKAKNQQISADILGRDTDEDKAVALANAAVLGKDPNLVNTDLDRYLRVTSADIQRVAAQYFVPEHSTVLIVTTKPSAR
ncbi:MAG: pitrilysin family protein [Candidatus Acidiferrales bacterium]